MKFNKLKYFKWFVFYLQFKDYDVHFGRSYVTRYFIP